MTHRGRIVVTIAAGATVGIGAITGVLWYASTLTWGEPTRPVVRVQPLPPLSAPQPLPPATPSSMHPLPDDSDELIRALSERLSDHPDLARFLVPEHLLRRAVAAVEAIADGYSPADELAFMRPDQPFLVRRDGDEGLVIAGGSYRRYDLATEIFASVDSRAFVAVFDRLRERLDEAHREMSWSDTSFEDRLHEAADHLLAVSIPSGRLAVERRTLTYAFVDDRLETLSAAQRQLLRMGPHNARAVQAKLRELETAFGWSPPVSPDPNPVMAGLTPVTEPVTARTAAAPVAAPVP